MLSRFIRVQLSATPWSAAHQASLSITNSRSLLKLMSIKSVMPSNHLILCHPLLLLPSIFPSIRVFSKESALRIRWPKDWSLRVYMEPIDIQRFSTSLVIGVKQIKMKVRYTIFRYKRAVICVLSHSVMSDSVTPRTAARQAPVSMGFSRQEYWSGLPFPPPRLNPAMGT